MHNEFERLFPNSGRLIYGCMGLGGDWSGSPLTHADVVQAQGLIETALAHGITVFDHADIYTHGKAEEVFGCVLKQQPSLREQMLVQSKCGIRFADENGPKRYDLSMSWVNLCVEQSLKRLNIETLDVLLLHRPDPLLELDELARTLEALRNQGKVAAFGVSNMHAYQIEHLVSNTDIKFVANQMHMSLANRDWLEEGLYAGEPKGRNVHSSAGALEYCHKQGIQLQAWGSMDQGRYCRPLEAGASVNKQGARYLVARLSKQYQASAEAIVLAWLMRHPAGIKPVIGTTNLSRLEACAQAADIRLSREHWYQLWQAARGEEFP